MKTNEVSPRTVLVRSDVARQYVVGVSLASVIGHARSLARRTGHPATIVHVDADHKMITDAARMIVFGTREDADVVDGVMFVGGPHR